MMHLPRVFCSWEKKKKRKILTAVSFVIKKEQKTKFVLNLLQICHNSIKVIEQKPEVSGDVSVPTAAGVTSCPRAGTVGGVQPGS